MSSNFHTSSKPLKEVDIRLPENLVKGAVKLDPNIKKYTGEGLTSEIAPNFMWTYVTFDKQDEVLTDLITRLSIELRLPQSGKNLYALKFEDGENDGVFLTDNNRSLIGQGFMLILTASPECYSKNLVARLDSPSSKSDLRSTLTELMSLSGDVAFASEFYQSGGFTKMFEVVENGVCSESVSAQSKLLQALLMLMDHPNLLHWSQVSDTFVSKIAENITGRAKQEDNTLLVSSLNIIDLILNSKSEQKMNLVIREVPFESLIRHLEKSDERVIVNVLTLMNSLYCKARDDEKGLIVEHLHSTPFRSAVENSVLRKSNQLDVGIEQQLVTVQRIQLNELAQKALRIPTEIEIERVFLLKIFSADNKLLHTNVITDERRAEFSEFTKAVIQTPPGSLAIETILLFATHHAESIAKISMESTMRIDGTTWSLLVVSVHLVQMLIEILNVIVEPGDGDRLMILFFKSDRPFLDLFAVMVRLFHRTWREMHASHEDITKVLAVVRKQMDICLVEKPTTIEKLEELLGTHSYPHMKKIWEKERSAKEAEELQSDAVKELREYLRPSIVELILKNRKNALKNGQTFGKVAKSKSLQKVAVSDIRRVIVGNEGDFTLSGHKNKKGSSVRGLTLEVGENCDAYHLLTADEQVISAWCDGINALIGVDKLSPQAQRQVERFLNMELKMRLLELDHVPNSIEIPRLPSNFDWITQEATNGKFMVSKV